MPTILGRNQLEQASGTMPRRENTKPKRAVSLAMRISMASCMVAPMPTAGPLTAAITGLRQLKIASVTRPPPSRTYSALQSISVPSARMRSGRSVRFWESNVSAPDDRSAPAQNARPAPVTTMARILSSLSARENASINSLIIVPVKALSFSGRLSVMVRIWSLTS